MEKTFTLDLNKEECILILKALTTQQVINQAINPIIADLQGKISTQLIDQ